MTSVLRRGVLAAADAAIVRRQVERHGQRLVARFVAGDSVADGLEAADALHGEGLGAILDVLGEGTATAGEAETAAAEIEELVATLAARAAREGGAEVEVAVKLSHLGAQRDPALAGELLQRLLKVADGRVFLWIDMEGSDLTETTVATYEALRPEHPALGLVLQAYLRRSAEDLVRVASLDPWVRIVKGAYLEPPAVAFTRKADVDRNFAALVGTCFDRGIRVAIASHDAPLVGRLLSEADARGLDRFRVELQVLYGVAADWARGVAADGHRVKVYVPCGPAWYRYFSRRLAERPANAWFLVRALLGGGGGAARPGRATTREPAGRTPIDPDYRRSTTP